MQLEDCNELMLPHHDRDTFEELPGQIRVHIVDHLEGVTPEMYEWWFGNMTRDTYMQWHPRDHKEFAWVSGWEPGRYVGATHMTAQTLGGSGAQMRADISFQPRAKWFDWRLFEANDVGVVICAIVHMHDDNGRPRPDEAVRFVHLGIRRDYGTELRSSFWIDVDANPDLERATVGRTKHVHEECEFLCGFLPELHGSVRPGGGHQRPAATTRPDRPAGAAAVSRTTDVASSILIQNTP